MCPVCIFLELLLFNSCVVFKFSSPPITELYKGVQPSLSFELSKPGFFIKSSTVAISCIKTAENSSFILSLVINIGFSLTGVALVSLAVSTGLL